MSFSKIKAGKNAPEEINVIIEIPQGGTIKYEVDKETDAIVVDRFMHGAMFYPFNYGYVPETHAEDGDPLDVLVVSTYPVTPGAVIASRPIGMLEMEDEAGIDTKIIALPTKKIDPFYAEIESIDDLPQMVKDQIKNMFDRYKDLEKGKWVKTKGFLGADAALDAIKESMK